MIEVTSKFDEKNHDRIFLPDCCLVCDSPILKNSVLFHCECVVAMCQSCALYQIAAQPQTYHNGLVCPYCRLPSDNIKGIADCQAEEDRLIENAIRRYKIRTSRNDDGIKKAITCAIESGLHFGSMTQKEIDNFDVSLPNGVYALKLELARLEYCKEKFGDNIRSITNFPLGPLEVLSITRNIILERGISIQCNKNNSSMLSLNKDCINQISNESVEESVVDRNQSVLSSMCIDIDQSSAKLHQKSSVTSFSPPRYPDGTKITICSGALQGVSGVVVGYSDSGESVRIEYKDVAGHSKRTTVLIKNTTTNETSTSKPPRNIRSSRSNKLEFCICRRPEIGYYVKCSDGRFGCNGWVHPECCSDLKDKSADELTVIDTNGYTCSQCREACGESSQSSRENSRMLDTEVQVLSSNVSGSQIDNGNCSNVQAMNNSLPDEFPIGTKVLILSGKYERLPGEVAKDYSPGVQVVSIVDQMGFSKKITLRTSKLKKISEEEYNTLCQNLDGRGARKLDSSNSVKANPEASPLLEKSSALLTTDILNHWISDVRRFLPSLFGEAAGFQMCGNIVKSLYDRGRSIYNNLSQMNASNSGIGKLVLDRLSLLMDRLFELEDRLCHDIKMAKQVLQGFEVNYLDIHRRNYVETKLYLNFSLTFESFRVLNVQCTSSNILFRVLTWSLSVYQKLSSYFQANNHANELFHNEKMSFLKQGQEFSKQLRTFTEMEPSASSYTLGLGIREEGKSKFDANDFVYIVDNIICYWKQYLSNELTKEDVTLNKNRSSNVAPNFAGLGMSVSATANSSSLPSPGTEWIEKLKLGCLLDNSSVPISSTKSIDSKAVIENNESKRNLDGMIVSTPANLPGTSRSGPDINDGSNKNQLLGKVSSNTLLASARKHILENASDRSSFLDRKLGLSLSTSKEIGGELKAGNDDRLKFKELSSLLDKDSRGNTFPTTSSASSPLSALAAAIPLIDTLSNTSLSLSPVLCASTSASVNSAPVFATSTTFSSSTSGSCSISPLVVTPIVNPIVDLTSSVASIPTPISTPAISSTSISAPANIFLTAAAATTTTSSPGAITATTATTPTTVSTSGSTSSISTFDIDDSSNSTSSNSNYGKSSGDGSNGSAIVRTSSKGTNSTTIPSNNSSSCQSRIMELAATGKFSPEPIFEKGAKIFLHLKILLSNRNQEMAPQLNMYYLEGNILEEKREARSIMVLIYIPDLDKMITRDLMSIASIITLELPKEAKLIPKEYLQYILNGNSKQKKTGDGMGSTSNSNNSHSNKTALGGSSPNDDDRSSISSSKFNSTLISKGNNDPVSNNASVGETNSANTTSNNTSLTDNNTRADNNAGIDDQNSHDSSHNDGNSQLLENIISAKDHASPVRKGKRKLSITEEEMTHKLIKKEVSA